MSGLAPSGAPPEPTAAPQRAAAPPRAFVLCGEPSGAEAPRVFGATGAERLLRSLARLGIEASLGPPPAGAGSGNTALFRADWVYDERLVAALCEAPGTGLVTRDGKLVAAHVADASREAARQAIAGEPASDEGFTRVGPDALVPAYSHELRKRAPALLEPLVAGSERAIEQRLFDASYKGITDLVTKFVWPPLALPAVRACARLGISPNAVTVASWLLVFLAGYAFATGAFAAGLGAAWLMTFLDTVDGKLARVTLRSSRLGHVLDHGLDILHPPFWWAAWGLALPAAPWTAGATAIAFFGYWLHRIVEGAFLAIFGTEIHAWRRLDARFRLITTRRNPNLILLTVGVALGRPDAGFAALAAWTVASIAFHLVRIAQAGVEALRGRPIHSEYEEAAASSEGTEARR